MLITFGSLLPFPTIEAGHAGNSQWWLSIPQRSSSTSQEPPNKRVQNHQKTSARRRILMTIFMDFLWSFFVNQIQDSTNTACGKWLLKISLLWKEGGISLFKAKCAYNISSCKRGSFSRLLFYYQAHIGIKSLEMSHFSQFIDETCFIKFSTQWWCSLDSRDERGSFKWNFTCGL